MAQRALILELVDTLTVGLTVNLTLGYGFLAASTTNTDAVNYVALFGLVSQTSCFVWSAGTRGAMDDI